MSPPVRSLLFFLVLAPVSQLSAAVLASYTFGANGEASPGNIVNNNTNTATSPSVDGETNSTASSLSTSVLAIAYSSTGPTLPEATAPSGNTYIFGGTSSTPSPRSLQFSAAEGGTGTTSRYLTFTITPDAGYEIDLTSLTLQYQQVSTVASAPTGHSPTTLFIQSSVTGFGDTATDLFTDSTLLGTFESGTLTLSSNSLFQNLTSAVTFRIYAYGSRGNTSSQGLRFDNITLNGDMVAVPEPSAAGLLLGGLGMLLGYRRLRKTPRLLN